jgi:hypothetical protein
LPWAHVSFRKLHLVIEWAASKVDSSHRFLGLDLIDERVLLHWTVFKTTIVPDSVVISLGDFHLDHDIWRWTQREGVNLISRGSIGPSSHFNTTNLRCSERTRSSAPEWSCSIRNCSWISTSGCIKRISTVLS